MTLTDGSTQADAQTNPAADLDDLTYQLDRAHVFHSWSAQGALHPMVLAGGQGCRVHAAITTSGAPARRAAMPRHISRPPQMIKSEPSTRGNSDGP